MQQLFDKLAAVPLIAKIGGIVGVVVLMGGGYWYLFYSDLIQEREQFQAETERLSKEKKDYEKRKAEYLAFRNEVSQLLEEQKELLRVLPKRDDIEQFIESVQSQIELSGLQKVTSVREGATPVEMYIKIPVKMQLSGTFHQINRFFKNVGDLKRIVNIEDLELVPTDEKSSAGTVVRANFIATTFQFAEKSARGPQAKAGGGQVKAGGKH